MSSRIPDETLSKVLEKIQLQVYQTNQQLSALRAQIAAREREAKLNTLTLTELQAIQDPNAPFYRSVGKMYVPDSHLPIHLPPELTSDFCPAPPRFLQESQPVVLSELEQKQTAITSDLEALQKKQKVRPPSHLRHHSDHVWLTFTSFLLPIAHTVPPKTARRRTGPPQRHLLQRQPSAATRSLTPAAPSSPCIHTDIQNQIASHRHRG
ncbi:hypothetical protein L1887_58846 [Cichorium endivia]|nr:hypothetical protein L1887_58846 [Cichorium endivia]